MGGRVERYFIPAAIGFAPLVLLALTWAPDGRSHLQELLLGLYIPLIGIELFVAVVALREGMVRALRTSTWPRVPTIALAILIAVAVITAVTAPNAVGALLWTAFWLIHLLFGFSVAFLCSKLWGARDLVIAYLAGFLAFAAGIALFATQVSDPAFDWVHSWPAVKHIRHFGYYAAAMIAMCIGVAASEQRPRWLAVLLLIATAGSTFALWTGSRGAIVGVVFALVIGLLVLPPVRRTVIWGGTSVSLAIGALIASQLPAYGALMGTSRAVAQTLERQDVSTGRTQIWLNALEAIRNRPIFGYGENQMATVAPFYGLGQTHNIVLQILMAWGAVGLICVAIVSTWFLARALPAVRRDPARLAAPFLALAALAGLGAIDGSLFHVLPVSIFAASAGMIAGVWRTETRRP